MLRAAVLIVDYGSGNVFSVAKALKAAGATAFYFGKYSEEIKTASHIVLPGVGTFADCKRGLEKIDGMIEALEEAVVGKGKPFLGICVGMQLMAKTGHENGNHEGLGWIDATVRPINPASLKTPHMGWNDLVVRKPPHPVFEGIETGEDVYFVHGYRLVCNRPEDVIAETDYGEPLVAAVAKDNMVGTQFHPEKSQATGLRLLANFLNWKP